MELWCKSALCLMGMVVWLTLLAVVAPQNAEAFNPMIHSSLSTGSSKWGGDWGTTTGKYGEFTCGTCHARGTGNIKRIKKNLVAPNGSDKFPIEVDAGTVTFLDTRDGSSDFGDDAGTHATSNKICESCHSQNQFHNYDTVNNTGGLSHENLKDCISCHLHSKGFGASCDDCHGNPPTTTAHLVHAGSGGGEYGLACSTCHPEDHDGVATDIAFTGIAATWAGATYSAAQKQCSNLYCHGNATADWDGGTGGACGDCHGDANGRPDGTDEPSGGSHLTASH
ncbi:MAG: CxxxxCH/CxxCH domain-containing protein, partial [Desulfuromonadales bacterium]|nr:CxxxxCH/CxxCH domain-containing protein [Desulfuromonadales bacterium]